MGPQMDGIGMGMGPGFPDGAPSFPGMTFANHDASFGSDDGDEMMPPPQKG